MFCILQWLNGSSVSLSEWHEIIENTIDTLHRHDCTWDILIVMLEQLMKSQFNYIKEIILCFCFDTQDAFFKIGRHEGLASLWSGLSPTLILAVPATICYFVSYEGVRLFMKDFYLKNNPGKIPSIMCHQPFDYVIHP